MNCCAPLARRWFTGSVTYPRVATNICWSFSSLARAAYEHAECPEDDDTPMTYLLSPFFDEIVKKLIETTDRPDGNQSNLRNAAYEALMEMIRHSPKDCYITVQKTTVTVLDRLNRVISVENHAANPNDRVQISDLQSLLCATLQVSFFSADFLIDLFVPSRACYGRCNPTMHH